MKSIFRFPGGKTKLLPQIMPFIEKSLQDTHIFCDAFIGGGSVFLKVAEKYPQMHLFCNDKDYSIFSFWELMGNGTDTDISELKKLIRQIPTIELYYQLRATPPQSIIEAAYQSIFFNRCSFSGDMRHSASPIGGKLQKSKWAIGCRYNEKKLLQQIDHIHELLFGRITVSNKDISDYATIRDQGITIYLDPPYVKAGKQLYQQYMKYDEHNNLANILKFQNNWILSYDNCEEIRELYNWANVQLIDASYCIKGSKTNWNKTKEVLILPS